MRPQTQAVLDVSAVKTAEVPLVEGHPHRSKKTQQVFAMIVHTRENHLAYSQLSHDAVYHEASQLIAEAFVKYYRRFHTWHATAYVSAANGIAMLPCPYPNVPVAIGMGLADNQAVVIGSLPEGEASNGLCTPEYHPA